MDFQHFIATHEEHHKQSNLLIFSSSTCRGIIDKSKVPHNYARVPGNIAGYTGIFSHTYLDYSKAYIKLKQ